MNSIHAPRLRERLLTTGFTRRRFFTILAVFLLITVALFIRTTPRRLKSDSWLEEETLGRPGVVYPAEDEWTPPLNWDPVYPVYTNFTR